MVVPFAQTVTKRCRDPGVLSQISTGSFAVEQPTPRQLGPSDICLRTSRATSLRWVLPLAFLGNSGSTRMICGNLKGAIRPASAPARS
jgi:hypothetical protein